MKASFDAAVATTAQPSKVQHDPSWVVQRAWSMFRLPRLQEVIRMTIADLHALPQPTLAQAPLLERDRRGAAAPGCDPVAEALRACCEELRDAAGMPGAEAERARHCQAVRDYIEQHPLAWSEAFSSALDGYRQAATQALQKAFALGIA